MALFVVVGLVLVFVLRHLLPTGLDQQITDLKPNQYYRPAKTLWDWLQLAGIPVALAFIAYLFQDASKNSEQRIAIENQRNDILQKYVDAMSELILSPEWEAAIKTYRDSGKRTNPQIVARARTQVALSALQSEPPDPRRRGHIVRFLVENELLQETDLASPAVLSLYGTDLRSVDLSRADLSNVDLRGVDLRGSNLEWTNLRGIAENSVDNQNLKGSHSELYTTKFDPKWQLVTDILNRSKFGKELTNKDLRDAFLSEADLSYSNLRNADFRGANLARASLNNSDLRGADLRGAVLDLAYLGLTRINWWTRFDPKWKLVWRIMCQKDGREGLLKNLAHADLSNASLFYAWMPKANLDDADLSSADLEGAGLANAKFSRKTRLLGTKFEKANLERCDLGDCSLILCNFMEAKMHGACLTGADCTFIDFQGANLESARLNKAKLWDAKLVGANLEKADFSDATFKDVDCAGANLRDSTITKEQLSTISNLSGAILPDGSKHS